MKVHFIAIGGSAMHNLAIALARKGYHVTGSDDEIFEPSRGKLKKEGILPLKEGWDTTKITEDLDAVILGMHARKDNPELQKAKALDLPIFSYPEYIYEQSKQKKRIVIGGSHGKTTITSMILHVLQRLQHPVDYMVGAQLEGYDCMVKLTEDNDTIVLEGDEYLSSPLDLRSKFHLYHPTTALLSGIAWDHINVFPTFENYVQQFETFCDLIQENGTLVYNADDKEVEKVAFQQKHRLQLVPYSIPSYVISSNGTLIHFEGEKYPLRIFGAHNLQNCMGAMEIVRSLGYSAHDFLTAMNDFTGAGKRLEKVSESPARIVFKDFAHSPSKLKATTSAAKEQFPDKMLLACMELHTFSSLKKEFLSHYHLAMQAADKALVYFDPKVVAHKKLPPITKEEVKKSFGGDITVVNSTQEVLDFIQKESTEKMVLVMMSSGNFGGIDYTKL